ncbi:hypothetical protein BGY98DRAFT_241522 [Russula aff. rugulosa BPL654]|nr:hypothetical protein BGY98DRAFT_241522 [Russula aff. rugulosa BPL654]
MPDERTNSLITWFNSALRGNQSAQTLVDMIQIGQWYDKHENAGSQANAKPKCRPAVKFRNIDENALQAIQIGDQTNDGGVSEHGDEPESDNMVAIDHVVREETRPRKETSKATQQVTTAPNWNW